MIEQYQKAVLKSATHKGLTTPYFALVTKVGDLYTTLAIPAEVGVNFDRKRYSDSIKEDLRGILDTITDIANLNGIPLQDLMQPTLDTIKDESESV